MTEDPNASRQLQILVGEQLSAVCFVQDYVEFHFDGPIVRALTPVELISAEKGDQIVFPNAGSRDAFCHEIGKLVSRIAVFEEVAIEISFSGGDVLRIPLSKWSRSGPEAAHFLVGKEKFVVF
jgi:hypothetical protein